MEKVALVLCSVFLFILIITKETKAVKCFQCSSQSDQKGDDNCGAYKAFDKALNTPIECNSEESHMPGSFCMKVTQQGPRGFIWDGRWRQVIRRCASVADTGVTGVCNWGVFENGDYWQECYCSADGCNGAENMHISFSIVLGIISLTFIRLVF